MKELAADSKFFISATATGKVFANKDKNSTHPLVDIYGQSQTKMFICNLGVGDFGFIQVKAKELTNTPDLPDQVGSKVSLDDVIEVTGVIEEREYNNEYIRNIKVLKADKVKKTDNAADKKATVVVQGVIGYLQGNNLTINIPQSNPAYEDRKYHFQLGQNEGSKYIKDNLKEGDVVKLTAHHYNKPIKDGDTVTGRDNRLEVVSCEGYLKKSGDAKTASAAIDLNELPF